MADLKVSISEQLAEIKRKHEEELKEAMEPARRRLDEIQHIRQELDREEEEIRDLLGLQKRDGRGRKRGKRMTSLHKKEILGRFITEGHIKDNSDLTKELRMALTDEGFGIHDFRKLNDYLPSGWEARSNGLRGSAARTTFHRVG